MWGYNVNFRLLTEEGQCGPGFAGGGLRACYLEGNLGQNDREEGYATAISPDICM